MTHTVEISDSKGNSMRLSVSVWTWGWLGDWRAIDKGMIRYNSGPVVQEKERWTMVIDAALCRPGTRSSGLKLFSFLSWGTVNKQGVGVVEQPWVIGLESGPISWTVI